MTNNLPKISNQQSLLDKSRGGLSKSDQFFQESMIIHKIILTSLLFVVQFYDHHQLLSFSFSIVFASVA